MQQSVLFVFLLSSLLTLDLAATCPDVNIQAVIDKKDKNELLSLADALQDCTQWQDSLGLVYHKLGVLYYSAGDYDNAFKYTKAAIAVREVLFAEEPIWELGLSYYNLGVFYIDKLQYYEAKSALERCLEVFQIVEDKVWIYNALLGLSRVYTFFGDYEKSETALQFIISDTTDSTAFSKAEAYLNLSNAYLEQERFEETLKFSELAAPIFESFESFDNYASSLHNSAIALGKLGQNKQAIQRGEEAMALYRSWEGEYSISSLSNVLALAYIRQDKLVQAEQMLKEGLKYSQANGFMNIEAICYDNYGELYLKKGDYWSAVDAFEQSILKHLPAAKKDQKLRPELIEAVRQSSTKYNLFIALYDYSRAALAAYKEHEDVAILKKALSYLRIGDIVIDQLRYDHSSEGTKLFWRERVRPFYAQAMAVCYELQDTENGFYFLEKSKAVLLLEALLASKAQEVLPDSLQQQIRFLKGKISKQREALSYLEGEDKKQTLTDILVWEQRLDELQTKVMSAYPQYRSIMEQTETVDLSSFRKKRLNQTNRTFIHYSYGSEILYALVMDAAGERLVKLGNSHGIEPLIQQYLAFFTAADRITNDPADFLAKAHQLYQLLLVPLNIKAGTELLIVPDGTLAYLPFEALLVKDAKNVATAEYLLQQHLLTYAFSATLFEQMCQKTTTVPGQVLALAPFANYIYDDYANLRFSSAELAAITQRFGVNAFQDEEATLANFCSLQQQYGVLHLSTHAYSSFEKEQPRIIFADSILYLSDLYQMQIPANLVVLSACQSNIGELVAGEGVLGLGRGFCYAGANSIIASLWNLNDKHTSTIISYFYDQLAAGAPKSVALRDAKLNFMNNSDVPAFQKSPYYWAGLTYYGDDGTVAINPKKGATNYLWIGGGVLLLLSSLLFGKRLSQK